MGHKNRAGAFPTSINSGLVTGVGDINRQSHLIHPLDCALAKTCQSAIAALIEAAPQSVGIRVGNPNLAKTQSIENIETINFILNWGDLLSEIRAPEAGVILFQTSSPALSREGILIGLARELHN